MRRILFLSCFPAFLISPLSAAPQAVYVDPATGALINTTDFKFAAGKLFSNGAAVDTSLAAKQPIDSDLTAIAALTTDPFGRVLLTKGDAGAVRTYIGAGTSSFDGVFSSLTSKPTTVAGYGITDFNSLGDARWSLLAHTHTFASLTSKPTTLSGYGITDAQPLDTDLTIYAGITPSANAQTLLGHTFSQMQSDLSLVPGTNIQAFNSNLTTLTTSTLGDVLYSSAANTLSKLAGNITSTKKFLTQTGTGTISAAPAWGTIASGDIPDLSATYQPLDGDLTSWALITRASGFDTFAATPTLVNLKALVTDETTVGWNLLTLANPGAITFLKVAADNSVSTESAATYRTSLGATTVGGNLFTLTNPGAVTFPQFNADNTVTAQSASAHRTALSLVPGTDVVAFNGALGTPTSGTLTNATGLPITGITSSTSAQLRTLLSDENGTGVALFDAATSPAFTTPKVTTGINDANGNSMLAFTPTTSAVDGFTFTNAATANPATVTMAATGSDSNINITLTPKGTGGINLGGGTFIASNGLVTIPGTLSVTGHTTFEGVTSTGATGTGKIVYDGSPTLVTPVLGAATATTINGAALDNLAWSTYTPTITASSGTITTITSLTGRYKQIGKTVFYTINFTVTTNGTGSGELRATIPSTAATSARYIGSGIETGNTGKTLWSLIDGPGGTTTYIRIKFYDATYPGADGNQINVSGTYELP